MDTNSPEFRAALHDHARSLGVDPEAESHLLSFVQEALLAEVPEGWEQGETEDGTLYYFNEETGESIWEHPLDGHYRELVKQKKAEGSAAAAPVVHRKAEETPQKSEVSKLEVYSFDDDSDDDIKPLRKPSLTAAASDKASRIGSLFTPQPAPAYAATSAVTLATSGKDSTASRSSFSSMNSGSTAASAAVGCFGRDRSWLLDNDDEIPTIPLSKLSTSAKPTEIKDLSSSSRGVTAAAATSSLSYTARLFGGNASSTPAAITPIEPSAVESLDLGGGIATGTGTKVSPRRGIASAIKGPFFQDMATAPGVAETTSSSSSAADLVKIKDLEKTNTDLTKQVDLLKKELETTKRQLETATQDAKEANYLKMKATESKAKLSDKESELAKAKQETAKLHGHVQRLEAECAALRQVQTSVSQQETVDARRIASELEALVRASQAQASVAAEELRNSRLEIDKLTTQLRDTTASLEREKRDFAALKEQSVDEQKQTRALREQVEKAKQDATEQLEQMKREMSDQRQQYQSVGLLQETVDRQAKYVKELEDKHKGLQSRLEDAEAKETLAMRETKQKDLDVHELNRKIAALTCEIEERGKQLSDLQDLLRQEQNRASEVQRSALSSQRSEDELDRKRQLLEREKQELVVQLRDRSEQLHSLQSQIQKAQDDHSGATAKLQMEIHALRAQLQQLKAHEVAPLEKQRDQLVVDADRYRDKLSAIEKELRVAQQELANEASKTHQLQVECEAWKRKEQQQKVQKETYVHEKLSVEKQLQSVQAEASTYKHDKRLEIDKLAFRLRELESQVAQKDYEIVRLEEKFTKAEAWRLKEARRVEERDTQLLDLKEELAQLKSRNIEAENNLVIHELRREKEEQDAKLRTLAHELEEERIARQVAAQRFQDETEQLNKAIEWQLPQLAAACVSRSSEEWTRKCNAIVTACRDDWNLKMLSERNELVQKLKDVDERRDHVEHKLQTAMAESEFLRKEVHRLEDNNKVLLDQLHTIRVYMMQRAGASAFPSTMMPSAAGASPPPPPPPPHHTPSAYSDFTAVNQLNSQLGVLHAQFQQLFDAHAEPRLHGQRPPVVDVFSPSDRFEIPSSPTVQPPRKVRPAPSRKESPLSTSSISTGSSASSSSFDETLDSLLLNKRCSSSSNRHKEKEELLATLEAIGSPSSLSASVGPSLSPPLASTRGAPDGTIVDSPWYQQNYWRSKYQH